MEEPSNPFFDPVFLQYYPLSAETVETYFARSDFYDKKCLNEQMKTHRGANNDIRSRKGVFYEFISPSNPNQQSQPLFVIKKWFIDRDSTELLRVYYIVQGYIYPAPISLHRLLSSQVFLCANEYFFASSVCVSLR